MGSYILCSPISHVCHQKGSVQVDTKSTLWGYFEPNNGNCNLSYNHIDSELGSNVKSAGTPDVEQNRTVVCVCGVCVYIYLYIQIQDLF